MTLSQGVPERRLALFGGKPIRSGTWPEWPRFDDGTERLLLDTLRSRRWAKGEAYTGTPSFEQRFGEAFSKYHGVSYCVPTTNGSSALAIALESLGVGYGDEVLVPALAWVACASAVLRVGAVPILVDVDEATLCMSPAEARRSVTARTAAIMVVHLACAVADLDAFVALSNETGIPLIEDCAQAHGSKWRSQRVGTFGKLGAFSFQTKKVLASGEGGCVITHDRDLYLRLQQLRADGRCYAPSPVAIGDPELLELGNIQGYNHGMTEFQASILLDRLSHLEEENRHRERNGEYLRAMLSEISSVQPLKRYPQVRPLTYYQFCLRLELEAFGGASIEAIRRALGAELRMTFTRVKPPINETRLYKPGSVKRLGSDPLLLARLDPKRFAVPVASHAHRTCINLHHRHLLAEKQDMEMIVDALRKVRANSDQLRGLADPE